MFEHACRLRVRYAETDRMGYVYYGVYAQYFEVARVEALRALGISYREMEDGGVMLPVHWGLFDLAFHGWTEPIERVRAAAAAADVTIVVPKPGQSFEPANPPPVEPWWPELPWQTAAQDPIVATKIDPAVLP